MDYFSYVQFFTTFLINCSFFFLFFFSFFYIDAVIFYNLFFLQNQTMNIELYQTNPYSIIQFYKNKRQLTNELLERICSSFRTLTKNNLFFVLCFVIFFFVFIIIFLVRLIFSSHILLFLSHVVLVLHYVSFLDEYWGISQA